MCGVLRRPETTPPPATALWPHLNRQEKAVLAGVILGWALIPLGVFYGAPSWADRIGLLMVVGLVVASAAVVALFFGAARRLDRECRRRLEAQGFLTVPLGPELLTTWTPIEHRNLPASRFDGFHEGGNASGYQRARDDFRCTVYGYSCGQGEFRFTFTVARLESPRWAWPDFSSAMGSRWLQIQEIPHWQRVSWPEDPDFSKACWLQAQDPKAIAHDFPPEARAWVLRHPEFRIHAAGPVLMLYSNRYRLIPGEAETFIDRAERMATEGAELFRQPLPRSPIGDGTPSP